MKVDGIIEKTFREANLKKIRIKVDPRQFVNQGFEHCNSFEGYVLEEWGNTLKVYLINPPPDVEPVQIIDKENARELKNTFFSKEVILKILDMLNLPEGTPEVEQIKNTDDPEFITKYFNDLPVDQEKLLDVLKTIVLKR
jgi:hypothetical protein